MYNASSPEFELLVGNLVDAFANELTADYNYHSSAVTKLRYRGNSQITSLGEGINPGWGVNTE